MKKNVFDTLYIQKPLGCQKTSGSDQLVFWHPSGKNQRIHRTHPKKPDPKYRYIRVFAQIQILARKFLSSTFSRFSDFLDQILAHDFGLNSFSAKIYFGRYIARSLYLFTVSIRMKEHFGCLVKGSIPLIITTLGILGASLRTCKSLSAYVLLHNIPVSRLENLYVYFTTTY